MQLYGIVGAGGFRSGSDAGRIGNAHSGSARLGL